MTRISKNEYVNIGRVVEKRTTAKAVLMVLSDGREIWVPKSQIVYQSGQVTLAKWFAEKEGISFGGGTRAADGVQEHDDVDLIDYDPYESGESSFIPDQLGIDEY